MTVGKQVVGIACTHDACTGQSECYTGCVYGDPAATPLFCDVSCCAGTAGRVEHEVARVSGHEDAAFDDLRGCLNDIRLIFSKVSCGSVHPRCGSRFDSKIICESDIADTVCCDMNSSCFRKCEHSLKSRFPVLIRWRIVNFLAILKNCG